MQVGQVDSPTAQSSGAIFHGDFTNPIRFDLAGFDQVWLNATDDVQEVGGGFLTGAIFPNDDDNPYRALVFNGTAASGVDLTPAGSYSAFASTVDGGLQGGWTKAVQGGVLHPVIWFGTAASIVNLLPSGADSGSVRGIKSGTEVGRVHLTGMPDGIYHAAIWKGTAASFVDKNPNGYQDSSFDAFAGNGFVGHGIKSDVTLTSDLGRDVHALLWVGNKVVDLNPGPDKATWAVAGNSTYQVGYYFDYNSLDNIQHACMWRGTAASFIDLQQYLPSTYPYSVAKSVVGNKVYGYAFDSSIDKFVAVVWTIN